MSKIVIIGSPSKAMAEIIAEKSLDVEFITESEARTRYRDSIDKLPRGITPEVLKKLKAIDPPILKGKSKYHK